MQEGDTFSPLLTCLEDFHIIRGKEILKENVKELFNQKKIETISTISVRATSSGFVKKDTYLDLKEELIKGIENCGRIDGVCMFLHGAMEVQGIGHGDTDLIKSIRKVVGHNTLISASIDLHANITPELVDAADILTAYRTAPHVDEEETRKRAASLLIYCLERDLHPISAMVKLPLIISGAKVITDIEPAVSVFQLLKEINSNSGILDSSILVGQPWCDVPNVGVSTIVIAEKDKNLAIKQAYRLADAFWQNRNKFDFEVETATVDESIALALKAKESTVFISDSGDDPTAGAPGDSALFVERLLVKGVRDAAVGGIVDAEAVRACQKKGIGAILTLKIGGKLDPSNSRSIEISGEVVFVSEPKQGIDALAVIRVKGIDIILTERRKPFKTPEDFKSAGIDPLSRKIIVVKLHYLFPKLREIAPRAILSLSPGWSTEAIEKLPFKNIPRPISPLDKNVVWKPKP